MGQAVAPKSLRSIATFELADEKFDVGSAKAVSAVAGLIAVASFSGAAEAQQSNLPPVAVDAPVERPRPAASKPSAEQIRARNALRRAAQRQQTTQAPVPFPNAGGLPADRNPYADPVAPYKVDRVQASGKFPEPLLNTPKTITVLSKEVLADKNITSLKEVGRSTAGVTLGSGEGGNAFGDRFFIRGFDARNDVFIDGIRDPAVSIRENFFTEQIEILRGPASSYAGRGTAGGAINIVTKQAADYNFTNAETTFGTDRTKRVTIDTNQVINPTFSVRTGGMFQDANVAGRNYVTDNRWGTFISTKYSPTTDFKLTTNYVHTDLSGLPDFGVPYYKQGNVPVTEAGIPRQNWYGFINRDWQTARQDFGTLTLEYKPTDNITLTSRTRGEHSLLAYIGTLPQSPITTNPDPTKWTFTASAQSRNQYVDVWANQEDATFKFNTGSVKHTAVVGLEVSNERVGIDRYTGLASEFNGSGAFSSNGALSGQSIYAPSYTFIPFTTVPSLTGNPTRYNVDSKALYVLDTANWEDKIIVNGGLRYDGYDMTGWNNTLSSRVNSDFINYNGGIVFKPVPIGSLYAAYATSTNPFGSELDGTSTDYGAVVLGGTILGPERNKAAEVGTKWELFDRHLLVSGALFQTDKDNARETVPINGVNTLTSGAAYRIRGIDIEASGNLTDRWSMFGGIVLMQSQVTKSLVPSNIGLPLANVAHQSFSLLSKYKFDGDWELGGQAVFRSKVFGGTFGANTGTLIPSYWRFDAFLEKKIDQHWAIKFYAQNLTNKLYYDTLYRSATPFVAVAPGRAFYVVTTAKF
ncbi:TonB-dependent receptor [Bradyrhizobium manausense]|uniref:TonB-dependent receptor n=1 Tax=Bradyrhizobium TaxID=374 RepID=UPI001BACEC5D|nr:MULTISPECIES: TonB-dependent receptor [Bradyrhizobium]MBR0827535.1 TonB-dependent receptor [Bradyrhizobium manausense]UVO26023.1 TonB-dependent receptor [Bradyrhizobium arachidis]